MLFTGKQQPDIAGNLFAIRFKLFSHQSESNFAFTVDKGFLRNLFTGSTKNCRISTLRVHFFRRNDQGETDYWLLTVNNA